MKTLTKQEAIEAMENGKKVTHPVLEKDWLTMENGVIIQNGDDNYKIKIPSHYFIHEDGWLIYEEKIAHTPLPWFIQDKCIAAGQPGPNYLPVADPYCFTDRGKEMEANARFITHAVNNHYELVDALKEAETQIKYMQPLYESTYGKDSSAECSLKIIQEVLKNAEQ